MGSTAFQSLRTLKLAAGGQHMPLPASERNEPEWQGIGYQLGGVRLVSAMGEVREILQVPRVTALPGVSEWMLGIANVRGRLLPVADVHRYLGIEPTLPQSQARLLVVEAEGLMAGLMVEASLGIQHFVLSSFEPPGSEVPVPLARIIRGSYRHGGRIYYEARLSTLFSEEQFRNVSTSGDAQDRQAQRSAMEK
jgi:twitching motility protein PilI